VGAHLAEVGLDPIFVNPWPENVQAIRERGLEVARMNGAGSVSTRARALHVCDVAQSVRESPIEVAFIAVKSYDTA